MDNQATNRTVYMDNNATTAMKEEVLQTMLPYFCQQYGNPSSVYKIGRQSKAAIEEAREKIAQILGAKKSEIFFTASGTESDNWAIKGVAQASAKKGNHIITSTIEHHGVLHPVESLEKEGFEVTYLPVDKFGLVSVEDLKNAIKPTTILVSIMYANNEIGTVQQISQLAKIAKENKIIFHTDAVQAVGHLSIDVDELGVDLLSISAHKFYGPKGVGALYIKSGTNIKSFINGGAQERARRAGTENVAGIVGMAKALELAYENFDENVRRMSAMRDRLIKGIMERIPYTILNGHPTQRLCNNVNVAFQYVEGESILLMLDMNGIAASSGSACTSGSLDPSHVLLAIGLIHEIAHGSLRLSVGEFTTDEDVDYVLQALPPIIDRLRQMSPLYEEVTKK